MQGLLDEFRCQYYGLTSAVRRDQDYTRLISRIKEVESVLNSTERERAKQ